MCSINTYLEKIIKNEDFINQNCIHQCPLECNRTEYKTSLTNSHFAYEIYFDLINKISTLKSKYDDEDLSLKTIQEGIVKLNIYYESLAYVEMSESISMNLVSLFSSIGGFMGMFLGMSLMTLVEVLEIIIKFFSIFF